MKIHLDTKDLINLIEKSKPCSADDFEKELRTKGHELAISLFNVYEISAPLLQKGAKTNVMRTLNRIESMPICFLAEAKIDRLELIEALDAFIQDREYCQISPFASRFDEIIIIIEPPATRFCLNLSMAEAVFMLWTENPRFFNRILRDAKEFKKMIALERALAQPLNTAANFVKVIERCSQRAAVNIPSKILQPLGEWIFRVPTRCPTLRLGYEVFHKIVKNIGDLLGNGDIPDIAHVDCVPYVDLITLDRRMCSYVRQACFGVRLDFENRICNNVEEILTLL